MGFKENLKAELDFQGMMVKELAANAGISKHTLDNYLSVKNYMPAADAAVKIARALGVSVEYLVTGEESIREKSPQRTEVQDMMRDFKQLDKDDRKTITAVIHAYRNQRKYCAEEPFADQDSLDKEFEDNRQALIEDIRLAIEEVVENAFVKREWKLKG
jgi:transcriptional regulator with XRE-family HTH domain